MSLDMMFGPCCAPARSFSAAESQYLPESRMELTADNAAMLKEYCALAERGLKIPTTLHQVCNILWAVDEAGLIWFALEEVVAEDSGTTLYPLARLKGLTLPAGHSKLGHPSLIERADKHARFGGEIIWDPSFGEHPWTINNASGRYGQHDHRLPQHLANVCEEFTKFGINLSMDYI